MQDSCMQINISNFVIKAHIGFMISIEVFNQCVQMSQSNPRIQVRYSKSVTSLDKPWFIHFNIAVINNAGDCSIRDY